MTSLEDALAALLGAVAPGPVEECLVADAAGRFATGTLTAPLALPAFDNSAMDGFALRSADVSGATTTDPVGLTVGEIVAAGAVPGMPLAAGQCARIFTGAPLPQGADAVVAQEDIRAGGFDARRVWVAEAVRPWENVRLAGEDVARGAVLVTAGQRLTSGVVGLLAAQGIERIRVGARPRVTVLASGNELLEAGQPWSEGRVYESNRAMLGGLARAAGAVVTSGPIMTDDCDAVVRALDRAFASADVVITSGGVSVGEWDFLKAAFARLGGRQELWQLALRPGKPFAWGRWGERLWFGLPGNPVSAFVTFHLLARPALLRFQGAADTAPARARARLLQALANPGGRRHFMRVHLAPDGSAQNAGGQGSHFLSSLARANGLVDVPPRTTLGVGQEVDVLRLD